MDTSIASRPVVEDTPRTTPPTNVVTTAIKAFHSALAKVSALADVLRKAGSEVVKAFVAQETKDLVTLADAHTASVGDIGMLLVIGIASRDGVVADNEGDFFAIGQACARFDFSDKEAFASLLSAVGKSKSTSAIVRFVGNHANAQAQAKKDGRKTGPKSDAQKGESGASQFIKFAGEVSTEVLTAVIAAATAALKSRK